MSEEINEGMQKSEKQTDVEEGSVSCPQNLSIHKKSWRRYFMPSNRMSTYKIATRLGYVVGPLIFIIIIIFNLSKLLTDEFFVDFTLKPLFVLMCICVLSYIYRYFSRIYRLKKIKNDDDIYKGISESIIKFLASLMVTYYFAAFLFNIIAPPIKYNK